MNIGYRVVRSMVTRFLSLFSLLLILVFSGCTVNPGNQPGEPVNPVNQEDILAKLRALPGITVEEMQPQAGGYRNTYQIVIDQPVDHDNPNGQRFNQIMYLHHRDETAPMVFAPAGYWISAQSNHELGSILKANCLTVAHRYFRGAKPGPTDWQYCTVRQAAADHHEIVQKLKPLYTGPWVSTGISKGGMTALFHKRFYPDDVKATVAYVAPFMFAVEDHRYVDFLNSVGTAEERQRIHGFQRRLLEDREIYEPKFRAWANRNGYGYTGDPDLRFEEMVLFYEWHYRQYYSTLNPDDVPGEDATPDEVFNHFRDVTPFSLFSDQSNDNFMTWWYQTATELGYFAWNSGHLEDLLTFEPQDARQRFIRYFGFEAAPYDPGPVLDIYRWLQEEGDNIIYIYGAVDAWSGGMMELTGETNAQLYNQPGADHLVKIYDLDERDQLLSTLGGWLGIQITAAAEGVEEDIPVKKREFLF